ncbi:MAG: hypothetical protein Q7P63_14140 [Verrucomicrobiota bacterium JB022]|nr:hypothetical protein [Verrucomicrobiota bacterium JB022]
MKWLLGLSLSLIGVSLLTTCILLLASRAFTVSGLPNQPEAWGWAGNAFWSAALLTGVVVAVGLIGWGGYTLSAGIRSSIFAHKKGAPAETEAPGETR